MMDWATETAETVNRAACKTVGDRENLIATALRKAKADGLRDAADVFDSGKGISILGPNARSEFARRIDALAARVELGQIERGNT